MLQQKQNENRNPIEFCEEVSLALQPLKNLLGRCPGVDNAQDLVLPLKLGGQIPLFCGAEGTGGCAAPPGCGLQMLEDSLLFAVLRLMGKIRFRMMEGPLKNW